MNAAVEVHPWSEESLFSQSGALHRTDGRKLAG